MIPFPVGQYKTILADPPWPFKNLKTGGSMKSGAAQHYPTMTMAEIKHLPIREIVDPSGAVLFLWSTIPMMPEALGTMIAWQFRYKTAIVWHKTGRLGMGFWFRGQCEICLVGVSGKVSCFRCQEKNIIHAKAIKHSHKPDEFFDLVEPVSLTPRIELFATQRRSGWDAWGLALEEDGEQA